MTRLTAFLKAAISTDRHSSTFHVPETEPGRVSCRKQRSYLSVLTTTLSVSLRLFVFFVLVVLLGVSWMGCGRDTGLAAVEKHVRMEYPQVPQLSTDSLAAWLEHPVQEVPLLLDVRTAEEYRVSHLLGAQRVDPGTESLVFLENVPHDTPIVTYCSVGYRSSELAQHLMERGYTNVTNLEGSIFAWVTEGRPIYRGLEPAETVHPYEERWSLLLPSSLRATEPSEKSSS